ncbi:MAG: hypothetical protein ACR2HN_11700 [Tepidiformaceae bacterium]
MDRNPITREQALAWQRGWEAVAAFERQELRSTPPEVKLARAMALMHSAFALGWKPQRTPRDEQALREVRRRWSRIYEHLGSR